ncbi:Proline-specific permease [Elsinoe australis]|uniref:Proline-specific permease n=1 Tax=Elsinoe australis TaxID=40998 RepID=A0A2P8AFE5_9PEZI|nr:Proline-specific permease [Elsinoe australis]
MTDKSNNAVDLEILPSVQEGQSKKYGSTHRGLKSRHIQLIALGGAIGTGLFVGSGATLATSGPAPLLMSYIIMSLLVWIVMMDLGEMTAYMPIKGLTVPYMVERFVDPSLGFATGWNYWFGFALLPGAEATAASVVIEYWNDTVPSAVWIAIVLAVLLFLNIAAVAIFGETEFWFASIKIIAIVGLIIMGLVLMLGGGPTHDRIGFRHWKNPGAFHAYLAPGNTGNFLAFWNALIKAGFAYIFSPELVTTTAGECEAPRRNIPKAARRFIYRILAFYVLGSFVIGALVPWNDPRLLGSSYTSASPFVIAIKNAGIEGLDHVINAVILTSAWSSGNAFVYAGSRMLYGLAKSGDAPRIFKTCNRFGVPYAAVIATWLIGFLAFLNVSGNGANVFNWLTSIITISGLINWIVILFTYTRFRKATQVKGIRETLPFKSKFQPWGTWFVMVVMSLITITNGFASFFPGKWNTANFITAYVSIPIFAVLYIGHKIKYRGPFCLKPGEVDVLSGLEEVEEITANDVKPIPKNVVQRIWFWIC